MTPRVKIIESNAFPLERENIDTDVILPASWLKVTTRDGLGKAAFESLRAEPGSVFSDPRYVGSKILVAGANFGCGSSREHAVWAMLEMGIRAVIAPSFSDIFTGNALKNGMLPIVLPRASWQAVLDAARSERISVNLAEQTVCIPDGRCFDFPLDPFRKHCLMMGLEDIDLTLQVAAEITDFERKALAAFPWVKLSPSNAGASAVEPSSL